jgi:hypothetical protein
MQGQWAPAWLMDVDGMTRTECDGALCDSQRAESQCLAARHSRELDAPAAIGPETSLACVTVFFILAQLALVFRLHLPSIGAWLMIADRGSATVLSFAIISDYRR